MKSSSDSPETKNQTIERYILETRTCLPEVITASGLLVERQWYLFNKIREFCLDEVVSPQPITLLHQ